MGRICNFLRLDENTAYSSLRKLHSVIHIPTPGVFRPEQLRFHHISFPNFLENPIRSGKFCLSRVLPEVIECSLASYKEFAVPLLLERSLQSCFPTWELCCSLGPRINAALWHQLCEFNYGSLLGMEGAAAQFANWLYGLVKRTPGYIL
ncbi:hypothetical protein P691DRAFT_418070 [Macrolepiota fuliginosa MF-IS2]|uniref:Uncharacterized protein n=1 Tax=Macrolepiota fuliginosa MF-IS2 TaxID=1400762 RepID=A0A9P5X2U1_9AGAR|nr:hypothetical protein P691DRAFT_418070 [Macrolepiota fuliginosa MF-IS2]